MKMNIDSCILYLNSDVVLDILKANKAKYLKITEQFPVCLYLQMPENPYLHGLVFTSKEDRDMAYNLLKQGRKTLQTTNQFYYKGEDVTVEMMKALLDANGDFNVWEKIEDNYHPPIFATINEILFSQPSSPVYRGGFITGCQYGAEMFLDYLASNGYLSDKSEIERLKEQINTDIWVALVNLERSTENE